MTDDVIEFAGVSWKVKNADCPQLNIGKTQGLNHFAALIDLHGGQVEAEESAFGINERERNEIAARRAADLQYAALRWIRRAHAEQRGDDREAIGMGLREGIGFVGHDVVGVFGGHWFFLTLLLGEGLG